jgi:hypothetical protein
MPDGIGAQKRTVSASSVTCALNSCAVFCSNGIALRLPACGSPYDSL